MKISILALLIAPLICFAADAEGAHLPLSPGYIVENGQTLRDEMKKVVVRFEVGSIMKVRTRYPDGSSHRVLHLVPNDVDARFTAPISPQFQEKLRRIGIDDIQAHFQGAEVTLEGYVSGTATALILSPTVWTYHISIKSFESIRSVKRSR